MDRGFEKFVNDIESIATLAEIREAQNLAKHLLDQRPAPAVAVGQSDKVLAIAEQLSGFYRAGVSRILLDKRINEYEAMLDAPKEFESYLTVLNASDEDKALIREIRDEKLFGEITIKEQDPKDLSPPSDELKVGRSKLVPVEIPLEIEDLDKLTITVKLLELLKSSIYNPTQNRIKISFRRIDRSTAEDRQHSRNLPVKHHYFQYLDSHGVDPQKVIKDEIYQAGLVPLDVKVFQEKYAPKLEGHISFANKGIAAKIEGFLLIRESKYWRVFGYIPLSLAREIVCKDIRLKGFAGNLHPQDALLSCKVPAEDLLGEVFDIDEENGEVLARFSNEVKNGKIFICDADGEFVIENCDIDSQEGLNLFVSKVREFYSLRRSVN
ncbi:hypothetical protein A2272_06765 [Candidatus Peregrinibacteria bacterium RIFOXYA12_FULL_33_12]|nr:MAG: hypothetical protein A2263_00400 [Candidatus Peregrinibacteria bacterium RIFOXYA2_FULL_33_21]OGJ46889.1 MAG: hypothetical protein A2272_06765 [Candidatus Peregrinibacteria bacterium RIFOXYA12_FULL_33_12]OGJ51753.1 MAG: hypothetical protein A2307_05835 [Candidatus Peregrinibacteria bacterium RIFOXYB2_FULL_33_20]